MVSDCYSHVILIKNIFELKVPGEDILLLFAHYMDSSHDIDLTCALVDGFCMLILHGRFFDEQVLSKLIIMFHNANTEAKVIQILSIFFETLILRKKQKYLQLALFTTLTNIANDDMSIEIQPSSVLKFFIQSTLKMNSDSNAIEEENFHNDIALTLLTWMDYHSSDKESLHFISTEMLQLKLSKDKEIRLKLLVLVNQLLEKPLHKIAKKNLKLFQQMVEFDNEPLQFSSNKPANGAEEDGINISNSDADDETEMDENIDENDNNRKDNESNMSVEHPVENNNENEKVMSMVVIKKGTRRNGKCKRKMQEE